MVNTTNYKSTMRDSMVTSDKRKTTEVTYRDKMQRVLDNHSLKFTDLKRKFQILSINFDEAEVLSKDSRQVLDESIMKGFST